MKLQATLATLALATLTACAAPPTAPSTAPAKATHTFAIGTNDFLLDGQRFQIRCGEVHAPRVPREYWRHRLQMAKAMGLNTVCAYPFWNSHEGWTIAYVDSEERAKEDGTAENAIDGQTANFWHTEWSDKKPGHPHRLVLDLGQSREVGGLRYIPRQGQGGGRIKDYKVYVGDGLVTK